MMSGEPITISRAINGWIVRQKNQARESVGICSDPEECMVFGTWSTLESFLEQHFLISTLGDLKS